MKTIVICGGGTLGHIMPGIAVGKILKKKNYNIVFIMGRKDTKFYTFTNNPEIDKIYYYDVEGINRKNYFKNISGIIKNYYSYLKIKDLLIELKPSLVIGMGGYISGIVIKAAHKLTIKTILHEQNAIMGLANKMCLSMVNKVFLSFPIDNIKNSIVVGNPRILDSVNIVNYNIPNHITVISGSLGSSIINKIMIDFLKDNRSQKYYTTLITGNRYYEEVVKELGTSKDNHFEVLPLTNNILDILSTSSLVISRSGATTIFEIIGLAIPSILIPSPNVTNNHQYYNAAYLENKNACILLKEEDLTIDLLIKNIEYGINNNVIKDNLQKIKNEYLKISWIGELENV